MENRPSLDRATLLPILLGAFSLFGILLVFLVGRFSQGKTPLPVEDTTTPFQYMLIGTEPGIATPETGTPSLDGSSETLEPSPSVPGLVVTAQQGASSNSSGSSTKASSDNNPSSTKTPSSIIQTASGYGTDPIIILNPRTKTATLDSVVIFRSETPSRTPGPTITITPSRTRNATSTFGPTPTRTPTGTRTNTPTVTPTIPTLVAFTPGTYDDSHPLFNYIGWSSITDLTAFQNTLHVSTTAGSTVNFSFTGQQIRLTFNTNPSFGVIRINIGGLNFDLDESNGTEEWVSALLAQGTYNVTITHTAGGSVNIDSIVIPDFNTPTPTATATRTPSN